VNEYSHCLNEEVTFDLSLSAWDCAKGLRIAYGEIYTAMRSLYVDVPRAGQSNLIDRSIQLVYFFRNHLIECWLVRALFCGGLLFFGGET
jgi:hypothetical protein